MRKQYVMLKVLELRYDLNVMYVRCHQRLMLVVSARDQRST